MRTVNAQPFTGKRRGACPPYLDSVLVCNDELRFLDAPVVGGYLYELMEGHPECDGHLEALVRETDRHAAAVCGICTQHLFLEACAGYPQRVQQLPDAVRARRAK